MTPDREPVRSTPQKRKVEDDVTSPAKRVARGDQSGSVSVVVSLTPIRKSQGKILQRNLPRVGIQVLPPESNKTDADVLVCKQLVVVTENAEKARVRLSNSQYADCNPTYVSTEWASSVLAAQRWLPFERYVLDSVPKPVESVIESPPGAKLDPSPSDDDDSVLPVWCSNGLTEFSDISEKRKFLSRLPRYLCQRATITQAIYAAPNKELCVVLEKIGKKRRLEQAGGSEHFADIRARAYQRASSALKCVPFKLRTPQDADSLSSFGPRVLVVANEFIRTGTSAEASLLDTDVRLRTIAQFQDMYGLGFVSARALYDVRGVKTVEELCKLVRNEPEQFPETVVKYLEHYDDLQRTRYETAVELRRVVEDITNDAKGGCLGLRFVLCGGFRRGEPSGHDVDLLYCRRLEHAEDHTSVLEEVVRRVQKSGLLREVLKIQSNRHGWEELRYKEGSKIGKYKYAHDVMHGIAEYGGCKFRLDIVGVRDASEFCFATLAWSGSTAFQRDIREWCEQKHNWAFSQHGLFERDGGERVKIDPQPMSEMDIFSALGLTYRAPFERSC